jgi:oligopeptide transport system permease protein
MSALPESRSPFQLATRRFRKNSRALVCIVLLAGVGLATLAVPWVTPHDYRAMDFEHVGAAPSGSYWMGTDNLGRDLMARVFLGGRISFAVGLLATAVSLLIGVTYGCVSAVLGGRTDMVMMRIVDILYGLPYMLVIIIIMAFLESRSMLSVFLVLGLFGWLTMARIVRGQVLSLREQEFVEAARALGARTPAIIRRHMIPNILGPVIVFATLSVPSFILLESFLSFLGLGVSEPETSWGVLISEGANALKYWWMAAFPGMALALTLFCLNAVGDGLRDAFDVRQKPQ